MTGQLLKREIKSIDGATLSLTLQNFGTKLDIAVNKVAFVNASTTQVEISDGTLQNNFILPANSALSIGEGLENIGNALNILSQFRKGTQLKIKLSSGAAGTGNVVATLLGE